MKKPLDGVQLILAANDTYSNIMKKEFWFVQDRDDRGTGTGISKFGLIGIEVRLDGLFLAQRASVVK
jgi:hypothetical protein